jgi:hypothetical protein
MNKSYGSNLRLNSQLNGKITNPPLMTLCVDVNHFNDQPIAVCEDKFNYLHIYVHSHYQKE